MAQWNAVIGHLAAVGSPAKLSWDELESMVGSLPASASKHRAWWSGDRPHVNVWRRAGWTIGELQLGETVTFTRTVEDEHQFPNRELVDSPDPELAEVRCSDDAGDVDLLLVTCVKSKGDVPAAAKDLYVSPLFVRQRVYAESKGRPWFILSAEHGLVGPDEWLAPYERYLPDTPTSYRDAWGRWVAERLDLLAGPLHGKVVELHAGSAYVDALSPYLIAKSATLRTPLEGLSMGQRLAWYADRRTDSDAAESIAVTDPESTHVDTAAFVAGLLDETQAMTPAEFLAADAKEWKTPGLYSWWVDAAGADDLTVGLCQAIRPGLIYAGLAGATRWPSGKRSTNTLWSRIAGMHLGGKHEFSTFRRTLGSILAHAAGSATIDENALTTWMTQHLAVVPIVSADPDTLGRLESEVLAEIDPPLNLQGMAPSAIRARLTELRRNHR
ncbi:hypothetical protein RE9425_18140 [Prescottella equi]|nr:hypothetical protein RE9425_18140 [Prescottella equi]